MCPVSNETREAILLFRARSETVFGFSTENTLLYYILCRFMHCYDWSFSGSGSTRKICISEVPSGKSVKPCLARSYAIKFGVSRPNKRTTTPTIIVKSTDGRLIFSLNRRCRRRHRSPSHCIFIILHYALLNLTPGAKKSIPAHTYILRQSSSRVTYDSRSVSKNMLHARTTKV